MINYLIQRKENLKNQHPAACQVLGRVYGGGVGGGGDKGLCRWPEMGVRGVLEEGWRGRGRVHQGGVGINHGPWGGGGGIKGGGGSWVEGEREKTSGIGGSNRN